MTPSLCGLFKLIHYPRPVELDSKPRGAYGLREQSVETGNSGWDLEFKAWCKPESNHQVNRARRPRPHARRTD